VRGGNTARGVHPVGAVCDRGWVNGSGWGICALTTGDGGYCAGAGEEEGEV